MRHQPLPLVCVHLLPVRDLFGLAKKERVQRLRLVRRVVGDVHEMVICSGMSEERRYAHRPDSP